MQHKAAACGFPSPPALRDADRLASEAKWEGLAWKIRLPAPVKASDLYKNRPLSVYRNLIISASWRK